MARARNIKPAFFTNDQVASCSFQARLAFIGLWTIADREGRLEDRPNRIKAALFPYDDLEMNYLLEELSAQSLISRYEIDGIKVIAIPKFSFHQKPHKNEAPSVLPSNRERSGKGRTRLQPRKLLRGLNEECGMRNEESLYGAIPPELDTDQFREAWSEFLAHRDEIRKPVGAVGGKRLLKRFSVMGVDTAIASLHNSVANGWQGVFEPNSAPGRPPAKTVARPLTAEEIANYRPSPEEML